MPLVEPSVKVDIVHINVSPSHTPMMNIPDSVEVGVHEHLPSAQDRSPLVRHSDSCIAHPIPKVILNNNS